MSIDNDTGPTGPTPATPPESPPVDDKAERKREQARERKRRYDERQAARGAGFSVPKRTPPSSGPRVHRTTAAGADFGRYNAGASYANAAAPAGNPFAARPTPAAAAPAEPVPEELAQAYGKALAFYAKMGVVALAQKKHLTEAERVQMLEELAPMVEAVVGGCTVEVVKRYNLKIPFVEEGVVAGAIGLSTWALFWGNGEQGVANAFRIAKAIAANAPPPPAPRPATVDTTATETTAGQGETPAADVNAGGAAGDERFKV